MTRMEGRRELPNCMALFSYPEREQIFARQAEAELGPEAVVEGHEIALQILAPRLVEACRQRLGRPIAGDEFVPGVLPAAVVIVRRPGFKPQVEIAAEQFADAFLAPPLERRR